MDFFEFVRKSNLLNENEITKAKLLSFYFMKTQQKDEFLPSDIAIWFRELSLATPNLSRLQSNLVKSRDFIRGKNSKTFRLHAKAISDLECAFTSAFEDTERIECEDSILPDTLYLNTRGFIEIISKQINACYENNIFDGCAVLMRRLLEMLLILSYEHFKIESLIKDSSSNYFMLDGIIKDAINNTTLNLSRNTRQSLNDFRKLGNYSAHKIYYNCKKTDISKVIFDFRVVIEELLYKSDIKK
ncbi:MAG TPA: hypothetical protein VEF53_06050 [Patescibacteria group bacterium]|nr:hypothetical protein [Patescibacteria group bacterium]